MNLPCTAMTAWLLEAAYFFLKSMSTLLLLLNKILYYWGAWMAQSVERPTSAQIMISQFVSSSPASGSVLTAQSLEPAWDSMSPSLSAPTLLVFCLSLKNRH